MSATNPRSEYEALVHAVDRLAVRFPEVDEATVRMLVADELVGFDLAWIRDYVPVLVEGRVTRRLRELARASARRAPGDPGPCGDAQAC